MKNKNWVKRKLGHISLLISSGITPSRKNEAYWTNGVIPWLKTGQLGTPRIYHTVEKVTELALKDTSLKLLPINTISLAMYGEGQTRGRVSILKSEMSTNQACCNIILNQDMADYEFIYYCLKNKYLCLRSISSGVRKNLNSELIKELEIRMLDNVNEQKSLISLLSLLDAKIELNNKINAELEAMAKLIYDYWFVQFDFPDENGKPYKSSGGKMEYNKELKREIPAGWEVKELGDVANITMGQSPSGSSYNENGIGKIFFQGSTDFGWRYPTIRQYTSEPKRMAAKGDILLSVRAPVGTLNIADNDCCIGRGLSALNSKDEYDSYLYYAMEYFKRIFDHRNNAGTTFGSITKDDLFSLKLIYPIDKTLKKYNDLVSIYNQKILNNHKETQHLSNLRDWLLPMLMNGQVTVGDVLPDE